MEITDLTEKYAKKYFLCLEDWSDDIKEAGKQIRTGPPPSYAKIYKKIARRVRKLNH